MNFYNHHIGDYDEATAHLSACEDGIYCRLIRKYMATEHALLPNVTDLKRLIRARTREERLAVDAILNEFFTLEADGFWHQHTCDENLADYAKSAPSRQQRSERKNARLTKHREERSRLFEVIEAAGQHAKWNTGIEQLRALAADIEPAARAKDIGPVTAPLTKTATAPATAPATPATAPHTPFPVTISKREKEKPSAARIPCADAIVDSPTLTARELVAEGVDAKVAQDWLRVRVAKKAPLTQTAWDGVKREAAAAGMTVPQAVRYAAENNWQGFKAAWLADARSGVSRSGSTDDYQGVVL